MKSSIENNSNNKNLINYGEFYIQSTPVSNSGNINIVYDPKNDFLDTGIDVTSGLTVLNISVTGSVNINWPSYPNNNGPDGKTEVGHNEPVTGLPHVAFIGKIGLSGSYFLIGSSYNQTVSSTGRLYVGIYDLQRVDNTGSFLANIQYINANIAPTPTPTPTPTLTFTPTPTPTPTFVPCPASCNNNLILNGDFSASSPAGDNGSATFWTINNADVTNLYLASGGTSSDLNVWVDLNSCAKGYIEQSFSTIFGKEYTVYFKLAGNNLCTPAQPCAGGRQDNTNPIKECRVSAAGVSQDYSFDITGKSSNSWQAMGWSNEIFTFTAISNNTTLRFESLSPSGCFGPAIDCVEVCPTCNNTNIDVSIPGTILRSGSYTNICFRVGGADCCNSGAPNMWSNEVCVAIPPLPPPPPQPTAPSICDLDISGYNIQCNYDENACGGGHWCNRAIFDVYVNDTFVFVSNLNNGARGGNVFTSSTIPSNISAQNYRGNGPEYKIEARPNSANPNPHLGICQIVINDLSGLTVFNACVPNSQVVYVAAGQNCPTPTPTPTPTTTQNIFTCEPCQNNLIYNGDFTEGQLGLHGSGGGTAPGWNYSQIDIHSVSLDPSKSNQPIKPWVDLNSCQPGYIEQVITTESGKNYELKFKYSGNNYTNIGLKTFKVMINQYQTNYSFNTNGHPYDTYESMGWTAANIQFQANSSYTTIRFESTCSGCGCYGPAINCVQVCEILENTPTPTLTSTPTPTLTSTPTPTLTLTRTPTQTPTTTQSQAINYCLYAWGGNNSGQFGNGTNLSSQNPLGISTSFDIYELDLGSGHSLAISTSRNLYSWGSNIYGQIGDGTTTQINSPTQISINSQNSAENEWLKISAAQFHSFAINSLGQLYGWGRNNNWQLGDGTNVDKNIPTRIGSDQTWTSVNTGPWHTLAINNLGEIFAWGNNSNGNIGDGTNINRLTPTKVGSSTNWTKVRAGSFSSFAINSLGELYAWGYNADGTLGDGTNANKNTPTRIGTETNWIDVSVFNFSVLAINSLGELYAWGYNADGQVGDGTTTDRNSPVRIGSATNWSAISSGSVHSLAMNNLGELYAWGNNQSGQLGDGTAINKNTPTRVGSNLNWQKIVGGGNYSMGLICSNPIATPTPTPTLSSNATFL